MATVTEVEIKFKFTDTEEEDLSGVHSVPDDAPPEWEGVWQMPTEREREIVGLLMLGMTNQQVADKLCLSVRTVETHRSNAMAKLHVNNRYELFCRARSYWEIDKP